MKFGVHKMTWGRLFDPGNLPRFFEEAAETGADAVEFRLPDEVINGDKAKIDEIKSLVRATGLMPLFSFVFPPELDFRSSDPEVRKRAVEHMQNGIRGVASVGGQKMGGALYSPWPTMYDNMMLNSELRKERQGYVKECLKAVMPVAEEYGVTVSIEPLTRYENYIINTAAEGVEFCKDINSPSCRVLLDMFHMNIEEDSIENAIIGAAGYIGHFHAAEPDRNLPHAGGRNDWKAIGNWLKRAGYDGTVTMEAAVTNDQESTYSMRIWRDLLPDNSRETRILAMKRGIEFLRKEFA